MQKCREGCGEESYLLVQEEEVYYLLALVSCIQEIPEKQIKCPYLRS